MYQRQVIESIGVSGEPTEVECYAVDYRFDFNCERHVVNDQVLFEIGRNDVGIPIVVNLNNRCIYFCNQGKLSFINSSFAQLLQSFEFVNSGSISDQLSDSAAVILFKSRMLEIDPHCFDEPDTIWSFMLEEMENGIM